MKSEFDRGYISFKIAASRLTSRTVRILGNKWFFVGLLVVFVLQSGWIAVSYIYPLPFDESYHFGVIKYYSHQIGPFIHNQPEYMDRFGDLSRYPSYLFHYLMSFPYRLIAAVTNSQMIQVIFLRIINIAFVAASFVVIRKTFQMMKVSAAITHSGLAIYILIPLAVFVPAHINYDNLLALFTALFLYTSIKIIINKKLSLVDGVYLVVWGTLASLTKYEFLPILAASFATIIYYVKPYTSNAVRKIRKEFVRAPLATKLLIALAIILSMSAMAERYGYNIITYKSAIPDCGAVLGTKRCMSYGPWARNYKAEHNQQKSYKYKNAVEYTSYWAQRMVITLLTTLSSTHESGRKGVSPFLTILYTFWILVCAGFFIIIARVKNIRKSRPLVLLIINFFFLLLTLWLLNFREYKLFGEPVAVSGRYIMLLLPFIVIVVAVLLNMSVKSRVTKAAILAVTLICMTQGGGVTMYILSSQTDWLWENDAVARLHSTLKGELSHFVMEKNRPDWLSR